MITEIVKLCALYILVRVFLNIISPSSKLIAKYFFWAGIALTLIAAVGPVFVRTSDDIHSLVQTYAGARNAASSVSRGVQNAEKVKESIPFVGTGATTGYPPAQTLMERIWPAGQKYFRYPVQGKMTQPFIPGIHHGIDLACALNTPVRAARAGTICAINRDNAYGNYVEIDHGGGWQTLYAHLNSISVKMGQHVFGGDVIGLSGDTGHSTGPHVHFEVRKGNVAVNPLPLMK